ncbi:SDR family NAD(P)-dependent oxidoreductase [Nocardioides bruguierae]|uniref:SDR family NAD(P)-dependent oxidoreductase n=1 Tax=Nocardioides bruguierae TaxID=2945102 RepID=UPI002020A353|nr:SDR family NAD(P)-dependent oxidoreductase [Nocardioides bruguierae]MCL8025351.1 SDR family NAD(P)-dependent oxidoreductase [Nocardioides bruguierae]
MLVTGASSGIGLAVVTLLRTAGHDVVLASRSAEALERAVAVSAGEGATLPVVADVSSAAEVRDLIDRAAAWAAGRGRALTGVVHCPAVLAYGRVEDVPDEVLDHALAVSLGGTVNVARTALRHWSGRGEVGSLVVVGSLLGEVTVPGMGGYATAKWGVHGLVRTLQQENRGRAARARVSLVVPGGVDTPVYEQAGTYLGRHGSAPPPVVSPHRVARAAVRCLERPRRRVSVGPANALTRLGFLWAPPVYDLLVGPLARAFALGRRADDGPGNVLAPVPEKERLRG